MIAPFPAASGVANAATGFDVEADEPLYRLALGRAGTSHALRMAERLGVGPDAVAARNPRVVYGRMTGWGQDGPLATEPGHDINYIALAGVLAHIGPAGGPPVPPINLIGDFGGGGLLLAFGVLAALVERATSGVGQVVDAAMVDGSAMLMSTFVGMSAMGFWSDERGTNMLDGGAHFYGVYETSEGGWISIAAYEPKFYAEFVRLMTPLGIELDPATQMRDLRLFLTAGYRLQAAQPFDLFPQTRHLECVLTLTRDLSSPSPSSP